MKKIDNWPLRLGCYSVNVESLCMLHVPVFQTVFLFSIYVPYDLSMCVYVGACGFKASRERVTVRAVSSRSLTDVVTAHTRGGGPILQHQKTECRATAHCCQGRGVCVCVFDMMTYHMSVATTSQRRLLFKGLGNFLNRFFNECFTRTQ